MLRTYVSNGKKTAKDRVIKINTSEQPEYWHTITYSEVFTILEHLFKNEQKVDNSGKGAIYLLDEIIKLALAAKLKEKEK